MTLGSHGDTMVPLPSRATVAGRAATDLFDDATLQLLFQRTRNGGGEIVGLLRTGSAYYAPASATSAMVRSILTDARETHPSCCLLRGEYGIHDAFVGVPAVLSRRGIAEISELALSPSELAALRASADAVRARCAELDAALGS